MATANINTPSPVIFDLDDNVALVNPDCHTLDMESAITKRLSQTESLVAMMSGEGSFNELTTEAKDNILWLIRDQLHEVGMIFDAYTEKVKTNA